MNLAAFVIFFHATAAMLLGWLYFRRCALALPPIGVINLWDVVLTIGGIILVPYLYLTLPVGLVMVFITFVFYKHHLFYPCPHLACSLAHRVRNTRAGQCRHRLRTAIRRKQQTLLLYQ
jgi:hypothetical protein